ncbi:MAG: hypothetical protein DME33_10960 [Verrucomicrobia bacterium]|nr:MAG: hypothetical protein DME33_10960 [Verrucomicrobiota bacterium]
MGGDRLWHCQRRYLYCQWRYGSQLSGRTNLRLWSKRLRDLHGQRRQWQRQRGRVDRHLQFASFRPTVVIAEAGTNGGFGGTILIEGDPVLEPCQFQVFGNGTLDLANATGTIAIGSLSGSGIVLLDGNSLTVGSNNFDTTFSGVIQESGALTKTGTGTLTLTGANTYIGPTTVSAGTLIASNMSGSATKA